MTVSFVNLKSEREKKKKKKKKEKQKKKRERWGVERRKNGEKKKRRKMDEMGDRTLLHMVRVESCYHYAIVELMKMNASAEI
jgi:hypothetical protein